MSASATQVCHNNMSSVHVSNKHYKLQTHAKGNLFRKFELGGARYPCPSPCCPSSRILPRSPPCRPCMSPPNVTTTFSCKVAPFRATPKSRQLQCAMTPPSGKFKIFITWVHTTSKIQTSQLTHSCLSTEP